MASLRCVILIDEQTFKNEEEASSEPEQVTHVIRLSLLRLLCYLAENHGKGINCLQWGYLLFNSEGPELQAMEKRPFSTFNLTTFEDFEDKLVSKAHTYFATLRANHTTVSSHSLEKKDLKNVLKRALSQVCTDFNWDVPDMSSPVLLKKKGRTTSKTTSTNFVFVISPFESYSHPTKAPTTDVFSSLLPKELYSMLTTDKKIDLFWLDHRTTNFMENSPKAMNDRTKLQDISKFGLIPIQLLALDKSIKYNNVVCNVNHNGIMPVSTIIRECLEKERKRVRHKTFQLPLNSADQELCWINLSPIWIDDKSCHVNQWIESWKVLKIQASLQLRAELFPFLTGCTFSVTPVKSDDAALFLALMSKSISLNKILIVQCQNENCAQEGLLRPVTDKAACLIVPSSPDFQNYLSETFKTDSISIHSLKEETIEEVSSDSLPTFNCFSLEKWAVPRIFKSATKEKESDEDDTIMFKLKERAISFGEHKPAHGLRKTRKPFSADGLKPTKKSPRVRKCRSANGSINLFHRSSILLEKSLSMKNNQKDSSLKKRTSSSKKSSAAQSDVPSFSLKLNLNDESNEETVIYHLKNLYNQSASGTGCLLTCTQTIVNVLSHFSSTNNANLKELVEKHFLLDAKTLINDFESPFKKTRQIREYQLQVLLRLELEAVLQRENVSCNCSENILILLRKYAFVEGALSLNQFLYDVIKENYGDTLRDLLEEISDELSIALFEVHSSADSDNEDYTTLSVLSHMSSSVGSSSIPSVSAQNNKRTIARHPSLLQASISRQIEVPKRLLPKAKKKETPKAKSGIRVKIRSSARLRASSSQKKSMANKRSKPEVKKVCRNLFESGKRKSTPKSVTPRKQSQYRQNGETPRKSSKKSSVQTPNKTPRKESLQTPTRAHRTSEIVSYTPNKTLRKANVSSLTPKKTNISSQTPSKRIQTPKSKGRTPKRKVLMESFSPPKKTVFNEKKKANKVEVKESPESFLFQDLMPSPVANRSAYTSPITPKFKRGHSLRNYIGYKDTSVTISDEKMKLESPLIRIYTKKTTPIPSPSTSKTVQNPSESLNMCSSSQNDSPAKNTRSRSQENLVVEEPEEKNLNPIDKKDLFEKEENFDSEFVSSPCKSQSQRNSSLTPQKVLRPLTPCKGLRALTSKTPVKLTRSPLLKLYSQLHISPENLSTRQHTAELLKSNNQSVYPFNELPTRSKSPKFQQSITASPKTVNLTSRWPVKKRNRLSRSWRKDIPDNTGWTVVNSPNNSDKSIIISLKRVPSFSNETTEGHLDNCEDLNRISPPVKRVKFNEIRCNDMHYKSPTALSLIHLATSPVLDLPVK